MLWWFLNHQGFNIKNDKLDSWGCFGLLSGPGNDTKYELIRVIISNDEKTRITIKDYFSFMEAHDGTHKISKVILYTIIVTGVSLVRQTAARMI